MSLTLPERWESALIVGRTPWSARDALVPLFPRRIRHLRSSRNRPGGRLRTRASAPPSAADGRTWQSKWHWAESIEPGQPEYCSASLRNSVRPCRNSQGPDYSFSGRPETQTTTIQQGARCPWRCLRRNLALRHRMFLPFSARPAGLAPMGHGEDSGFFSPLPPDAVNRPFLLGSSACLMGAAEDSSQSSILLLRRCRPCPPTLPGGC
jgi:hypothetical protein